MYKSSLDHTPTHSRGRSRCKITQVNGNRNPYHLISEDGGAVYGWVRPVDVAAISGGTTPSTPAKKSAEEIAREVIAGKWGNGADRVNRLTAAGYDAKAVQAVVNRLIK